MKNTTANIIKLFVIIAFLKLMQPTIAQQDDPENPLPKKKWPAGCNKVEIISSADQTLQPAFFLKSSSGMPRPLIVRLHAWSSDYSKVDGISHMCLENDYNYIHPNFRGPNNHPDACGSPLVVKDIDDAIDFAIKNANVDSNSIHIIGGSGGGYATLLCYMKTRHHIRSFTAWASITNLVDYYYECAGRRSEYEKYMHDLEKVTSGLPSEDNQPYFNKTEAIKRSPVFMDTPTRQRMYSKLFIYAGIHDGCLMGDVPFIHSLKFFNKVVTDFDYAAKDVLFSTDEMLHLLDWQTTGDPVYRERFSTMLERRYTDKVKLVLFEGGHEMVPDCVLDGVKGQNLLIIGDSNGTAEESWVEQLREDQFQDLFYNTSVSGNTIGFDNSGKQELNTLRQINQYLNDADQAMHGINKILIMLGTNDCKSVFKDNLKSVPPNMKTLLNRIKAHPVYKKYQPEIFVISPPPFADDVKLADKYKGGEKRIAWLFKQLRIIAENEGCHYIDTYSSLSPVWDKVSADGIHLNSNGHKIVADIVNTAIWK